MDDALSAASTPSRAESPLANDRRTASGHRLFAWAVIVVYLALSLFNALTHVVGDPGPTPLCYYFHWDMFPFYETESVRPVLIAQDIYGRGWQLVPGPYDQFRWGVSSQGSRADLDRRPAMLKLLAEASVRRFQAAGDPPQLVEVIVMERRWPVSRNRPNPVADPARTGDFTSHVRWRVAMRANVDQQGRLTWNSDR